MMKVIWKNGKSQEIDADIISKEGAYDDSVIEIHPDNFAILKKRTFYDGEKREYEEEEDKEVAIINLNEIRYIKVDGIKTKKKSIKR